MAKSKQNPGPHRSLPITRLLWTGLLLAGVGVSITLAVGMFHKEEAPGRGFREEVAGKNPSPTGRPGGMVYIPGGTFRMGNDFSSYRDQRPAHDVVVDSFWMDEHEVTNRQFAEFVAQTVYVTTTEQRGWSFVFDPERKDWVEMSGANWRHPGGPHTRVDSRGDFPVVHVSWHDAEAYARWAGKRLPTEAEWEYAARSGFRDADFPWGRRETIDGKYQANYWQGWFPDEDLSPDGFDTLAPVGSYEPNRFGLFDVSGNVWEWCQDWYHEDYYRSGPREGPRGPKEGEMRVQRGGSWLSAENYCPGYKVSTRSKRRPNVCYQDVGFRCVTSRRPAGY